MAERKPFLIRIDADLRADLESWAQDELRSVNGQIEYLLRQAVQKRKGGPNPALSSANVKAEDKPSGSPSRRKLR
jgi:hypothetical protein